MTTMITYRGHTYRVASPYAREGINSSIGLTHRQLTPDLYPGALLFGDDVSNSHYGPHVWTLQTELPEVPDYVYKFAAEYYSATQDEIEEVVDPPDITDTAGCWDDHDFLLAVWEEFEDPGYRTFDGAVVLDADSVQLQYHYESEVE